MTRSVGRTFPLKDSRIFCCMTSLFTIHPGQISNQSIGQHRFILQDFTTSPEFLCVLEGTTG